VVEFDGEGFGLVVGDEVGGLGPDGFGEGASFVVFFEVLAEV
jgi:hypothetical protein